MVAPDPEPDPDANVIMKVGEEERSMCVNINDSVEVIVEEDDGPVEAATASKEGDDSNDPQDALITKEDVLVSPSKAKRVLPVSPTTPRSLANTRRNYKELYEELKRKTLEYTRKTDAKLEKHQRDYDTISEKYQAEMESYKLDYSEREVVLAAENHSLKEKIKQLEEEYRAEAVAVKIEYEHIISRKEELLQEATTELENLKKDADKQSDNQHNEDTCAPVSNIRSLKRNETTGEIFRNKPKKKINGSPEFNCEFTGCENDNVDMVKCNTCDKWVCEDCNDVPVAKLKIVMNKCKSVFFICKGCEARLGETPEETMHTNRSTEDLVSTLTKVFESKVKEVETKFTNIIEKKLGEKLEVVNKINEHNANATVAPEINKTYAKVLEVPMELRKIMKEAKNNERVEETEVEKRARNFVIHGAEEIGENPDEIAKNDAQYIEDILKKLGVTGKSGSITRLGQPNEKKKRPIKIVMSTNEEKDNVMANLRQLKGTESEFGKISITNDHTKTERDQIREMSEKAKEKSKDDKEHIYKVRGDPKNGLRLVPFPRH